MPLFLEAALARLEGACTVEEAEPLLEWLRRTPAPVIDLTGCTHLHTAVLQVLLAARAPLASVPEDAFLARICADLPQGPGLMKDSSS